MLCHEIAALRLFLCAQTLLFLFQFRTSSSSSPFTRGAKNAGLAAATAILGNPNGIDTASDSELGFLPKVDKKTFPEAVPTGGSIELRANTPRTLVSGSIRREEGLLVVVVAVTAVVVVVVWRWGGWMPLSQRTRAM